MDSATTEIYLGLIYGKRLRFLTAEFYIRTLLLSDMTSVNVILKDFANDIVIFCVFRKDFERYIGITSTRKCAGQNNLFLCFRLLNTSKCTAHYDIH